VSGDIPLALQTVYAELLERAAAADFDAAFTEPGTFTPKLVKGRRYWYFQPATAPGRQQRYVGPESPDLLDRIARHKATRSDAQDRRALVSALTRAANLPRPLPRIGEVVAALAAAGVFRLRGVLVGTVAYQTYPAMLGVRLAEAALHTDDVDIAQFADVSVAVDDHTPAMLAVLQAVDPSFRPVPHLHGAAGATRYQADHGLRVDFLTPNTGRDSDAPTPLPALGTNADPLRFLDFLIREPELAVLLHAAGILVSVPAPQRFAVHKLIVARRRRVGEAKPDKDLKQAKALLDVLAQRRPHDLRAAWAEAWRRGKIWRQLLGEGLGLIDHGTRDRTLSTVGMPREIVPGLDLVFHAPAARCDLDRDVVTFDGKGGGETVRCAVSREALEDHFGADGLDGDGRLRIFRENRTAFEQFARAKYLTWPVEQPGAVLIRSEDIERLRQPARRRP
jgi:hypothetical protein